MCRYDLAVGEEFIVGIITRRSVFVGKCVEREYDGIEEEEHVERVVEEREQYAEGIGECLEGDGEQSGAREEEKSSEDVEQVQDGFELSLRLEHCHGIGFLVLDFSVFQGSHGMG